MKYSRNFKFFSALNNRIITSFLQLEVLSFDWGGRQRYPIPTSLRPTPTSLPNSQFPPTPPPLPPPFHYSNFRPPTPSRNQSKFPPRIFLFLLPLFSQFPPPSPDSHFPPSHFPCSLTPVHPLLIILLFLVRFPFAYFLCEIVQESINNYIYIYISA